MDIALYPPCLQALAAEYKQLVGREAQKAFRQTWAQEQASKVTVTRSREQTNTTVDTTKGEWMAFGRVVCQEGGGKTLRQLPPPCGTAASVSYWGAPGSNGTV